MRATFQHYLRQSQYWSRGMAPAVTLPAPAANDATPTGDGGVVMPQHGRDASYATPSMTAEQRAAHIAAGCPPLVEYSVRPGERLPPHLRRQEPRK